MKIVQALKESSNAISANFDGLEVNHFFLFSPNTHGASSCILDDVKKCSKLVKLESVPVCFVWGSAAAGRERCGRRFRRGPSALRGLRSHKGFHCTLSARWPEPSWSHARYSTPTLLKWQKSSASLKYGGRCCTIYILFTNPQDGCYLEAPSETLPVSSPAPSCHSWAASET